MKQVSEDVCTVRGGFKGTVSWDRFQKCWRKWTDLGLNKGCGWFLNFSETPLIWSDRSCKFLSKFLKSISWDSPFKVTVRPDQMCMRVVPLDRSWKGHQSILFYSILFYFDLENFDKSSKFWTASYKNPSNHYTHSYLNCCIFWKRE